MSEITIESKNLQNVSVEYVTVVKVASGNQSTENATSESVYSTDVPDIIGTLKIDNMTYVNYSWTPKTDNITGFTILATDDKQGSATYTPSIIYCTCNPGKANCIYDLGDNETEEAGAANTTQSGNATLGSNTTVQATKGISKGWPSFTPAFF